MAYVKVALDAGVYTKHSANVLAWTLANGVASGLSRRHNHLPVANRTIRRAPAPEETGILAKRTQYRKLDKGHRPITVWPALRFVTDQLVANEEDHLLRRRDGTRGQIRSKLNPKSHGDKADEKTTNAGFRASRLPVWSIGNTHANCDYRRRLCRIGIGRLPGRFRLRSRLRRHR